MEGYQRKLNTTIFPNTSRSLMEWNTFFAKLRKHLCIFLSKILKIVHLSIFFSFSQIIMVDSVSYLIISVVFNRCHIFMNESPCITIFFLNQNCLKNASESNTKSPHVWISHNCTFFKRKFSVFKITNFLQAKKYIIFQHFLLVFY